MEMPEPKTKKTEQMPHPSGPYALMDRQDENIIIASYTGQTIETMVYDIPFRSKRGQKTCGHRDCDYRGKENHIHVTGISVNGVNELTRLMGGVRVNVTNIEKIQIDGRMHWRAVAVARDYFTLTEREAEATCPCDMMRRGDMADDIRGDFSRIIAAHKAERNAARKLLPQTIVGGIASIAEQGRTTFDERDVKRLFKPFWMERKSLKDAYFNRLIETQVQAFPARHDSADGFYPTPALEPPSPKAVGKVVVEKPDEPETHQPRRKITLPPEEEKPEPVKQRAVTSKQYGMLIGQLTKECHFPEDMAKDFISENITTITEASNMISQIKKGITAFPDQWLAKQLKNKKAEAEEDGE